MGINQRARVQMTDEEIDQFLNGRLTMSMATIGGDERIPRKVEWQFVPVPRRTTAGDTCPPHDMPTARQARMIDRGMSQICFRCGVRQH